MKGIAAGWPMVIAATVLTFCLVVAAGPALSLGIILALAAVLTLLRLPAVALYATMILAFTAFPSAVPTNFSVSSISFAAYEPTLLVATFWAVATLRPPQRKAVLRSGLLLFAILALGVSVGLLSNNPLGEIVTDVRPLVWLICAVITSGLVFGSAKADRAMRLIPWILWFSASMMVLSSATGLPLEGRSEQATLYTSGTSSEATRLLTQTNFLAVAVICIVVALLIGRHAKLSVATLSYLFPAILIVTLGFSRNSILAIGVAVLFAIIASRSVKAFATAMALAATLVCGGLLLNAAAPSLEQTSAGQWVNVQVEGFQNRVLTGLDPTVQSRDGSTQFRETAEGVFLRPAIADSPGVGHGFGYAYKAAHGPPGSFTAERAPYYAHNYYLWLLVKTGAVGLILFVVVCIFPVVRSLDRPPAKQLVLAATVAGLMAASFVAPIANGRPTSTLLGLLVGALIAANVVRSFQTKEPLEDPVDRQATSRSV